MSQNQESSANPEPEQIRKMFCGGITPATTDETLIEKFGELCGAGKEAIQEVHVVRKEGSNRLIGFVLFNKADDLEEVLLKRDQFEIDGKKLTIKHAIPKRNAVPGAEEETTKLFLSGLPKENPEKLEADIREYIEGKYNVKYGTIDKIEVVVKDKDATPLEAKGFAFVTTSSEDFADRLAYGEMTFQLNGRELKLRKSIPKEKLQQQQAQKSYGGGAQWGPGNNQGAWGGYYQQPAYGGAYAGYSAPGYGGYYAGGYGGGYY